MPTDDSLPPRPTPGRSPETDAQEARRRARLAAALRENLRKRKAGPPAKRPPESDADA